MESLALFSYFAVAAFQEPLLWRQHAFLLEYIQRVDEHLGCLIRFLRQQAIILAKGLGDCSRNTIRRQWIACATWELEYVACFVLHKNSHVAA